VWRDREVWPELKITECDVADPAAFAAELSSRGPGLPVILVFADPSVRYGQLMAYIRPVLETHPTVYVFVEEEADGAPDDAAPDAGPQAFIPAGTACRVP
jgi:hypothetical protein